MGILPGVLGFSFAWLPATMLGTGRTSSPCDVLFKYGSDAKPCDCPARGAIPPKAGCAWHAHLLRDRLALAVANRRRQGFGAQEVSARQAAQSRKRVPSFTVSQRQFMKCPGQHNTRPFRAYVFPGFQTKQKDHFSGADWKILTATTPGLRFSNI
jgi:hypothetical protein